MSCVGRLSARQHFPILLLCRERNLWPAYGRWMRIRSVVDIELVIWQTTTTYGDQMFVLVCRRQNRYQFVSHMRLFSAFSPRSVLSIFLEFVLRRKYPKGPGGHMVSSFRHSSVSQEECFGFWWQRGSGSLYEMKTFVATCQLSGNLISLSPTPIQFYMHPAMPEMKAACIVLCKLPCQLLQFVENTYFYY